MTELTLHISRIRKKIWRSPDCDYLYHHFDSLVKELEERQGTLSNEEVEALKGLILHYAQDSLYNTYSSANWVRYSARCFYCADYLVRYLQDDGEREDMTNKLNRYFIELIHHYVALIIPAETFDKYLNLNLTPEDPKSLYDIVLRNAVRGRSRNRYFRANEITLALTYTMAIDRLIREYVKRYSDYSPLKEWIPSLETTRLAKFWYEYDDSPNYYHSRERERATVIDMSDKLLELQLGLMSLWFWHDPQEVVDTLSTEDLIETLEVSDDDKFERALNHLATMPYNEKVACVLKHFTHDDEAWIVILSRELLAKYMKKP